MKRYPFLVLGLAGGLAFAPAEALNVRALVRAASAQGAGTVVGLNFQGRNTITGMVFDDARRPAADIYVELLDDLDTTVRQVRTSTSGRYEFTGLSEGRFKVRVRNFGTDFLPWVQEVQITNVSGVGGGTGGETRQVDVYLRLRPEVTAGPFAAPGTVFAQEVPGTAKKLYDQAVMELRAKKEQEAFANLRKAIELFPEYWMALDRLGSEYAVRGNQDKRYFEAARVLLGRAVEVNPKGYSSVFGLGFTQYQLGQTTEAIENLQKAVGLYGKSPNGYLWLGIAQKRAGKLAEAEAALKRANELSKGKEADVHWQLAGVYSDQKRYTEAADELELYLKQRSDARDAEKIRALIKQMREKASTN